MFTLVDFLTMDVNKIFHFIIRSPRETQSLTLMPNEVVILCSTSP